MFGIGRRRTHGQLARAELNRSVDHLARAATYASRGVGRNVTPRARAATVAVVPAAMLVRDRAISGWFSTAAALAPVALATRSRAARAGAMMRRENLKATRMARQKKARRRGGLLTGLVAAGAVAGVAGAVAARRRREQQEWAEYDPAATLEPMRDETETLEVRPPTTATGGTDEIAGRRSTQDLNQAVGKAAPGGAARP